jgi:hypothetical protein
LEEELQEQVNLPDLLPRQVIRRNKSARLLNIPIELVPGHSGEQVVYMQYPPSLHNPPYSRAAQVGAASGFHLSVYGHSR